MNPVLRNILAVICGLVVGSLINGALITVSGKIIPPPNGADVTTMEGLKASLHLFEPKHFIFPFLAHALGTLSGALITAFIATTYKMRFALAIGVLFFIGGLINVFLLPAPMWFNVLDLAGAYFPFAFIAGRIAERKKLNHSS
jgi:hypothetical protein